jgi:hypothetical protein
MFMANSAARQLALAIEALLAPSGHCAAASRRGDGAIGPTRTIAASPVSIARIETSRVFLGTATRMACFHRSMMPEDWLSFLDIQSEQQRIASMIDRHGSPLGTAPGEAAVLPWHSGAAPG